MGVSISGWQLARAVSERGQLGVVSGTALDCVLARRLQDGDPGGHVRRALKAFPDSDMADRILKRYFLEGGKDPDKSYRSIPLQSPKFARTSVELLILSNFVEVWLAREGHSGIVGVNYLEKIQLAHLPSIYGAMLAGVDYVLMGAGIPLKIPGILDLFVNHEPATYPLPVTDGDRTENFIMNFDPGKFLQVPSEPLKRPEFLPIISSNVLALTLSRKANGSVNGFIVEGPTAGGHNAPPRGAMELDESGEPIYGKRDEVNLEKLGEIGLPFWVAGGSASPEKLREVLDQGGAGIQVGSAFALCEESGMEVGIRKKLLDMVMKGVARVFTDPVASPTGFPFKVAQLGETLSDPDVYRKRTRCCDLGYLREAYRRPDGEIGYRCPSEPVADFLKKGGGEKATEGRKCICNSLASTAGFSQVRKDGEKENPIVTCGSELSEVLRFISPGRVSYNVADVLDQLLGKPAVAF